ncbi:MAG: response regulator transcription factor [Defluviitaleaceae bacterium]|nr:response regulator transcription factor [Defluviitaleaceae bacterium]
MIWIVEDDEDIREIVLYALRTANYEASGFENGRDFLTALEYSEESPPDLVILDIMLPGDDGLTILKKLRQHPLHQAIPIIMLTAKASEYDKVKGLDLGADDYLTKPFSVMELISRIKALLRRSNIPAAAQEHAYANILMNTSSRTVTVDSIAITLTFKEYELLHYLLINTGIVLSRDKILSTVWGYDFEGESRTLDMHIKSLRKKLGAAGELIKTIRNVGYKLG